MARKETVFTATDGRDAGKQYLIREMSATQAESWAIRMMLAMGKVGIEIPEAIRKQGLAGLVGVLQNPDSEGAELVSALLGVLKVTIFANMLRVDPADALPLLDEMMSCVQRQEQQIVRPLTEDDIEEVATRLKLRTAIWNLHTDFSFGAALSTSESAPSAQPASSSTIKPPQRR